jgi:hypothetical protein
LTVPAPKHRAAALALSAAVVQVGIAYLLTPEAAALGGLPEARLIVLHEAQPADHFTDFQN